MKRNALFARYGIAPLPTRLPVKILDLLTWLWYLGLTVGDEFRPRVRLSAWHRWRAWCRGFRTRSYVLYRLDINDSKDYLSDYAATKAHRINGPFNGLFRNKLVFAEVMERFGVPHARVHALLHCGSIKSIDGTSGPASLERALARLLGSERSLVLKPAFGGGGTGIMFLAENNGAVTINGVEASLAEICSLLAPLDHYLVTEFVVQADYAARVYPHTTNTLRILTLWDHAKDVPFIAAAVHRFGNRRSFPVDNFHRGWGGISAKIDLTSGELGPGATLSADGRLGWYERHPDSGVPVRGLRIPFWPETMATMLRIAAHLPYAPAVGWDLVITDTGCRVLEGNSPPHPAVWQVHEPLLGEARARSFYERHGII